MRFFCSQIIISIMAAHLGIVSIVTAALGS